MKYTLIQLFTILFAILITPISFGQNKTITEVNPVKKDIQAHSIVMTPKSNAESKNISNISPNDWHSENSVDGAVTITKKKNQPQVIHNEEFFKTEILRIDNHIEAINSKISSVNSDQTSKSEAEASGWFDDMERIKSELEAQKIEVQETLNKIEGR